MGAGGDGLQTGNRYLRDGPGFNVSGVFLVMPISRLAVVFYRFLVDFLTCLKDCY